MFSNEFFMTFSRRGLIILCAGVFAFGYLFRMVHWKVLLRNPRPRTDSTLVSIRDPNSTYTYINPLLACDLSDERDFTEFVALKRKLQDLVDEKKKIGFLDDAAIYYRDLNRGRWIGINHEQRFVPASLFKVPIMMAYFKLAESDTSLLKRKLRYFAPEAPALVQNIAPELQAKEGVWYPIEELIRFMIVFSDNNAGSVLLKDIDQKLFQELMTDMGIDMESTVDEQRPDFLTAKAYALLFRMLRNATFLNREYSEKALELLSQSAFKDGIVAGTLDHTVPIAHKFGERARMVDGILLNELHDCGIIYEPTNPYLLCILTRGKNLEPLKTIIQEISKIVYESNTGKIAAQP